jgi:hypothetical protein
VKCVEWVRGGSGECGIREPPRNHSIGPRCATADSGLRTDRSWGFPSVHLQGNIESGHETWRGLDAGETDPCGKSDGSSRPCGACSYRGC